MATLSFERDLEIDTDEKAEALLEAINKAKTRKPLERIDCTKMLDEGREFARKGRSQ